MHTRPQPRADRQRGVLGRAGHEPAHRPGDARRHRLPVWVQHGKIPAGISAGEEKELGRVHKCGRLETAGSANLAVSSVSCRADAGANLAATDTTTTAATSFNTKTAANAAADAADLTGPAVLPASLAADRSAAAAAGGPSFAPAFFPAAPAAESSQQVAPGSFGGPVTDRALDAVARPGSAGPQL